MNAWRFYHRVVLQRRCLVVFSAFVIWFASFAGKLCAQAVDANGDIQFSDDRLFQLFDEPGRGEHQLVARRTRNDYPAAENNDLTAEDAYERHASRERNDGRDARLVDR